MAACVCHASTHTCHCDLQNWSHCCQTCHQWTAALGLTAADLARRRHNALKHAGARFQRIAQELEASAAAAQGAAVWRLQPLFHPPEAPPEQLAAAQQVVLRLC